jgi:hypothetical protein
LSGGRPRYSISEYRTAQKKRAARVEIAARGSARTCLCDGRVSFAFIVNSANANAGDVYDEMDRALDALADS